jgi:hypothetical protein
MTRARTTSERRQALHHHQQYQRGGDPHHPQGDTTHVEGSDGGAAADSHHPQAPEPAAPEPGERECRCHRQRGNDAWCERDRHLADPQRCGARRGLVAPPPGALRPLARALLSVAVEVHAERKEVRRVTGSAHGTTLRMETKGLRHPVRSGVVSGVLPPATPERTPSAGASPHVGAALPPPVENSDCIGDCA